MSTHLQDKVKYVIVYVDDLKKSEAFYSGLLGLEIRRFPVDSKFEHAIALRVQGTTIVLMEGKSDDKYFTSDALRTGAMAPSPGRCYPTFEVKNLADFHNSVRGKAECMQEPSQDKFGEMAVYRDPDGLLFSVVQMREEEVCHGIVFSGGGAYGAFELGILRHLAADVKLGMAGSAHPAPGVLTGTSVGAFNATALACRLAERARFRDAVEDLVEIWTKQVAGDLHNNGVFRIRGDILHTPPPPALPWPADAFMEAAGDAVFLARDLAKRVGHIAEQSSLAALLKMLDLTAIVSTEPLRKLVESNISWEVLQKAPCVLRIATTDWTTGRVQEFAHYPHPRKPGAREEAMTPENLRDAVLASTAIPGVFRPVEVQTSMISPDGTTRRLFADGGLVMNSPLNPAIDAGATVIHLIGVDPEVGSLTLSPIDNTVEVLQRSLTTAVASHIESDMDRARLVNRIAGVVRHEHSDDFYRAVTIHRYNPSKDCLGGVAGLLDFSASHIQALMDNGEKVAREHKCETAGCVRVEPKNA